MWATNIQNIFILLNQHDHTKHKQKLQVRVLSNTMQILRHNTHFWESMNKNLRSSTINYFILKHGPWFSSHIKSLVLSNRKQILLYLLLLFIFGIQPLGRSGQRPEFSQATGMALVRCILGKFLGVACHCFPPLFRCSHFSPPGVSTSATTWEIPAAEVGTVGENIVR